MNDFSNRETQYLAEYLTNTEDFFVETVKALWDAGCDFESLSSIAYELEHWCVGTYFYPFAWPREFGQEMPMNVVNMAVNIGSLWRVEWREVAVNVQDLFIPYLIDNEYTYPECLGVAV